MRFIVFAMVHDFLSRRSHIGIPFRRIHKPDYGILTKMSWLTIWDLSSEDTGAIRINDQRTKKIIGVFD